jgi:hypothetical protein
MPRAARIDSVLLGLGVCVLSAAYFAAAGHRAATTQFWMDEVLAMTAARLPSWQAIADALWNGAEFSPPTYHFGLHALVLVAGSDNRLLVPRLPSILAIYGAALCVLALLRSRVSPLAGLVAFGFVLDSDLFDYAVQVRQYALLAFGMAAALLLWDGLGRSRRPVLRAALLAIVQALCVGLHFYGVLVVATIGLAELIWLARTRQFRLAVWLGFIPPALVAAAVAPLALHLAAFSAEDGGTADYYAKPSIGRLLTAAVEVMVGGAFGAILLVATGALAGAAQVLRLPPPPPPPQAVDDGCARLYTILLALGLMPLLAFALALGVTHSFSPRYVSAAALLLGLGAGCLLDRLPAARIVAIALLPVFTLTLALRGAEADPLAGALACLHAARPGVPVVVGEGLLFLELSAAVPEARASLVYLLAPPGTINPDPTNEHQVKRLARIDPGLTLAERDSFLAGHPSFDVLFRPLLPNDLTSRALLARGLLRELRQESHGALLFRAGAAAD